MLFAITSILTGSSILLVGAALFMVGGVVTYLTVNMPDGGEVDVGVVGIHDAILQLSARKRLVNPALKGLADLAGKFNPAERVALLEKRIAMAGMSVEWPMERVQLYKLVFGILGAMAGGTVLLTMQPPVSLVLGPALAAAGWMGFDYVLDKKAKARQLEVEYSLPDILDQLTIIVEAGLGFEAAFQRVVDSNDTPLAHEFGRVLRSIRLGMPRSEALNQLLDRTNVIQLRMFVRALNQADRSGIPIGTVFRVQADEAREKRRQKAEEKAMALPVKLLLPLVLFILPALFIAILGPAVVRIKGNGGLNGGATGG